MVKRVEVLHGKFPLEGRYGVLQECCARCGDHNVINIKQQVYHIGPAVEDEQGGVGLGLNKSQSDELRGEPVVPSLRCLLQPVERLVEVANPVRLRGINKPHRLAVVDCLRESTMQEHVFTSSWWTGQERETGRKSTVWTVAGLTTGLKVSS
jgi:hypothetical protein